MGIPLSLVFVTWFLSGIVMIYTGGMPALPDAEYLASQPDLDLSLVQISPVEAGAALGSDPGNLPELRMLQQRPLYYFPESSQVGVFADTGEVLRVGEVNSKRLVAEFLSADEDLIVRDGVLEESDQWTLGLQQYLPLQKFNVEDGLGSQIYVSARHARVVLHTTATDRLLAWAGAIPHWFYIESLRESPRVWATTVVWTATLGCLFVVLGLVLLFTQWRRTRPFSLSRAIPYRGLHRWHYLLGGFFGVFTLTWTFSGLLSMEPYAWTNEQGYLIDEDSTNSAPHFDFSPVYRLASDPSLQLTENGSLKLLRFVTIMGEPHFEMVSIAECDGRTVLAEQLVHVADLAEVGELPDYQDIVKRFSELLASTGDGVEVANWEVLREYDRYYYPRNSYSMNSPPLPVLRVELNDSHNTWYYLDADNGRTVYLNHRNSRRERWLYNGFHSLDYSFWYDLRPLWDIGMIVLLLGGAALSGLGGYLGFRRLLGR